MDDSSSLQAPLQELRLRSLGSTRKDADYQASSVVVSPFIAAVLSVALVVSLLTVTILAGCFKSRARSKMASGLTTSMKSLKETDHDKIKKDVKKVMEIINSGEFNDIPKDMNTDFDLEAGLPPKKSERNSSKSRISEERLLDTEEGPPPARQHSKLSLEGKGNNSDVGPLRGRPQPGEVRQTSTSNSKQQNSTSSMSFGLGSIMNITYTLNKSSGSGTILQGSSSNFTLEAGDQPVPMERKASRHQKLSGQNSSGLMKDMKSADGLGSSGVVRNKSRDRIRLNSRSERAAINGTKGRKKQVRSKDVSSNIFKEQDVFTETTPVDKEDDISEFEFVMSDSI